MDTSLTPTEVETKLEMARAFMETISEIQNVWMLSIIMLSLFPPIPKTWRDTLKRIGLVTVIGWVWLYWFRIEIRLGWSLLTSDLAAHPNYSQYDGVGGNVAVLILGWLPFLLGSVLTLLLAHGVDKIFVSISRILKSHSPSD